MGMGEEYHCDICDSYDREVYYTLTPMNGRSLDLELVVCEECVVELMERVGVETEQ